jgi:hypothetical protein
MRPHEEEAALPREDQRTTDDGEAEHEWQKKNRRLKCGRKTWGKKENPKPKNWL